MSFPLVVQYRIPQFGHRKFGNTLTHVRVPLLHIETGGGRGGSKACRFATEVSPPQKASLLIFGQGFSVSRRDEDRQGQLDPPVSSSRRV
jgi:hypothetical protein